MDSLKILILSYRSAPFGGGQGIYVKDLSKTLMDLGHDVTVFSGPPYPELDKKLKLIKSPGLNLFETFNFKDRFFKFIKYKDKTTADFYEFLSVLFGGFPEMRTFGIRAKKHILKNQYDLVIDNQSVSYGMEYIQILTPLIEVIHHPITMDLKHELATNKNLIYRFSRHRWYSFLRMQKKVAPLLKNILTPSHNSKKDIIKDFKVKPENVSVIHNAVDSSIFRPYPNIKNSPHRLITTASADVPLKGLDFSLYALSELANEFQDIELLVIGAPKEGGHTERLIKKLNLNKRVTFKTGITKDQIAQEYAKSSVAIVSSLYEGFGYPVAEAMSCSIPLVATDIASIPEITDNFATLIPPKNSDAISDSVRKIFLEPDLYNEIAAKGRIHIQNKFNWQTIGMQYEALMNKVIKNHKPIIKGNNANF